MKRLIKFGSTGLAICGAIAITGEASAQIPAISQSPDTVAGQYRVTIYGTPRTQVPVSISGAGTEVSRQFRANGCGHVIIPNAADYAQLMIGEFNISTATTFDDPAIAPPTCLGTTSSQLPSPHNSPAVGRTNSWNLGDGRLLVTVPVDANAPNGRMVDVTYSDNSPRSRFVSLNACGLGTITRVGGSASISVNEGTPIEIGNIPQISPLRCLQATVIGAESDHPSVLTASLPDVFKDYSNNLYFKGSSGATIPVGLEGQAATRSVTSDRCGGLTVGSATRPQTSAFTIGSDTIDPASLSVGLKPNCKKQTDGSYAYDVAPTGNITTSAGQVFVKSTTAYPTGFGDRRILQITSTGSATRSLRANACGIANIRNSNNSITPSTQFTHNGNNYTVSNLPIFEVSCVNTGTSAAPNMQLYRGLTNLANNP